MFYAGTGTGKLTGYLRFAAAAPTHILNFPALCGR